MNDIGYFFAKVKYRLCGRDKEILNDFFRKHGVKIAGGGKHCWQYPYT